MMYWLVFYNGFDKPEVECAFSEPFMVKEYAEHFIFIPNGDDRFSLYSVYLAHESTVLPLSKFLENVKEY